MGCSGQHVLAQTQPHPPQEEPPGRAGCWEPWLSLWPFPTVSGRQEERSIALRRDAVWLFGPCCGWGAQKGFGLHTAALPRLPAGRGKAQLCRGTGGADGCRHRGGSWGPGFPRVLQEGQRGCRPAELRAALSTLHSPRTGEGGERTHLDGRHMGGQMSHYTQGN